MQKQIYRYQTLQRMVLDGIVTISPQELTQINKQKRYSKIAELRTAQCFN